jgi:hypothetical protein
MSAPRTMYARAPSLAHAPPALLLVGMASAVMPSSFGLATLQ